MQNGKTYADWIAVDWGTSNFRAWAMGSDGTIRAEKTSQQGMSTLSQDQFEPVLLSHIDQWLTQNTTPVIACGMVGSRQGWSEAGYKPVPCTPTGMLHPVENQDKRIKAHILPGLKQATHPDVMRGEETQIAGFLSDNSDFDGVLCLPGTHAKWVRISAGEVVSFQTFMTGEIFAHLSKSSVLKHSVDTKDFEEPTFLETVTQTLSRPETLAAKLFQIRSADLLENQTKSMARAKLSGLLLGAELAAARPYWLGQNLALIGAPRLNSLYKAALTSQGVAATEHTGDDMTLKGLTAAYRELST